jgi:hypothetical protein
MNEKNSVASIPKIPPMCETFSSVRTNPSAPVKSKTAINVML